MVLKLKESLIILAVLLAVILGAFHTIQASGDGGHASEGMIWPTFKHDIRRTGYIDLKPYWRFKGYYPEWSFQANFCISSNPVVADVNNDNINEVLVSSCDGNFYVLRGTDGRLLWKIYTGGRHSTPAVGDINGDGIPDVVVGGEEGNLYVLRGTDGRVEWMKKGLFVDVRPAIYDFLNNGKMEVVVGSVNGNLYMFRWDGKLIWKDSFMSGVILAPSIGDVDGDGKPEIVIATGNRVSVVNPLNGKVKEVINVGRPAVPGVALYDINGDGCLDGLLSVNDGVVAVDFKHRDILWSVNLNVIVFASPSVGPVIPGSNRSQAVISTPGGIFVLNISNGKILYRYPYLELTEGAGSVIGDVDGDGINEIIAGDARGTLAVIDVVHGLKYYMKVDGAIRDPPTIADADGDGLPEILFGSRDHHLYCLHGVVENVTRMTQKPSTTSTMKPTTSEEVNTSTNVVMTSTSSPRNASETPPPFAPSQGPNIPLILGALVAAVFIIALTYYLTRRG